MESETQAELARNLSDLWQQATTLRAEPVADPAGDLSYDDALVAAVVNLEAEKATSAFRWEKRPSEFCPFQPHLVMGAFLGPALILGDRVSRSRNL